MIHAALPVPVGEPGRPRVLLVDDNASLLDNLAEILEDSGYAVLTTGSCAGALEAAAAGYDLALVDIRLPDGDGTVLALRLKERVPDGEIILLTGFASVESAVAALRAGACAYLVKPCATPDLLLTVGQAMRQVRLNEEKRELTRRAQVAEKLAAVGTLTAGLSHEIKNPLNAAALQLSVLERRIGKLPEETRGGLLSPLLLVRDEIHRLNRILEDFLQFARPREFMPYPVDIKRLLGKIVDLLEPEARARGLHFETHCDASPPIVAGDEVRLQQVFVNLVLNAVQATPDGGVVRLVCRAHDREIVVAVEDTGPGVPPDVMQRIFEPFFTTKAAGSGLGLPIVNAFVTQHGGEIVIDNVPGSGARFTVRLPAYVARDPRSTSR